MMKGFRRFYFALMILSVLAIPVVSQTNSTTQNASPDSKQGLQLSLKLYQSEYHLKEDAGVIITLKNVGEKPLAIFKDFGWGVRSSFSFYLIEKAGRVLHQDFLDDAADHPPFPKEAFAVLKPNESIELKRFFGVDETNGIVRPGAYQVMILYHSPVARQYAPKELDVWVEEYGDLEAKADFKVVP